MAGVKTFGRVGSVLQPIKPAGVKTFGRVEIVYNTPDEEAALEAYAVRGAAVVASNATVSATRALDSSPAFKKGFDIGTGACQGESAPGAGQDAIRKALTNTKGLNLADATALRKGFDVAQALQHGITKAGSLDVPLHPGEASGFLVTTGVAGSTSSGDTKAAVMSTLTNDANATAGATKAIEVHKGLFRRMLDYFGL